MGKYSRHIGIVLVCLVIIFGAVLWGRANILGEKTGALAAEISLKPVSFDMGGVDLGTNFQVTSLEEINLKELEKSLAIEPEFTYTLKSGEGNKEALLVPTEPLAANQIYKFSLALSEEKNQSWAFQTKADFRVVSTLPRDMSGGIPLDTGIEITFSHLDFADIKNSVEINPQVEGRWEIHKKTAVFIPKKLKPSTLYTVKVKKGIKVAGSDCQLVEDYLFQFETQSDQNNIPQYDMYLYENIYEYAVEDNIIVRLDLYNRVNKNKIMPEVQVMLFKYSGAEQYIKALKKYNEIPDWAYHSRKNYKEDISSLEKSGEFSTPIMGEYDRYIMFPEKLEAGFYLAQIAVGDLSTQVWLQVTNLGIYSVVADDKTLVWVNDLALGSPVPGAQVLAYGEDQKGTTNEEGIATFSSSPEDSGNSYFIISQGERVAVNAGVTQTYRTTWEKERKFADQYWKYLYLDRSLFKPDDTINFWGMVKPREANIKELNKVKISVKHSSWAEPDIPIISKEIEAKNNVLSGSIKLPNLAPGYYLLVMEDGTNKITQMGFEVQMYTKPSYQIEVTPTKKALFVGEKTNFELTAAFFEGTGAANMKLDYHLSGKSGSVTTDSAGKGTIVYSPKYDENYYYPVRNESIYLHANLPESGEITAEETVIVLNNDLILEGEGQVKEDKGNINMSLNRVTLDKYLEGQVEVWDQDAFKGDLIPNHNIRVLVYKDVWDREEDGEYYDFINKKVQKRYIYTYRKEFVTEGSLTTDAEGKGNYEFTAQEDQSYQVELRALDFRGNMAVKEVYLQGTKLHREYDYQWYYLSTDKKNMGYKVGEEVVLTLKNNENNVPDRKDGFLFIEARKGLKGHELQNTGIYQGIFQGESIPNYYVLGAYFDGRYYHEINEYIVAFDEKEKALDVSVIADKKQYQPGEKVNLQVEVKNRKGQPVQGIINLNLVDEALYALRGQNANILSDIYRDYVASGIRRTLKTHQTPQPGGGAEHGGEGGGGRIDLRDTVLFATLTTDSSGKATTSFTLPDNLTSWRLTCEAITKDLEAGSTVENIIVKLPFFVDITINNRFLSGDQPVVYIRSFGDELKTGENITYIVDLKKEGDPLFSVDKSGKAFNPVDLALPSLESGAYTLTVKGTAVDNFSDTLTLPFVVQDSFSEKEQTDFYFLDKESKIKGSLISPTTLRFSDYEGAQYLNILLSLSGEKGNRVDQKLGAQVAEELIAQYFPGINKQEIIKGDSLLNYQTTDGGIALLPYSSSELELSAKIAALSSVRFDEGLLATYLKRIADDPRETRERGIVALYGLAALGEPVLQEISALSQANDLTPKEKIYLILAALELGNKEPAGVTFAEFLTKYSEDLGPNVRINVGKDQDDILEVTSMAASAAGSLGLDVKDKLANYVHENSTTDILTNIDQLLFLREVLPKMPSEVVGFSWSVGSRGEKVKLEPGETFTLILTPEELNRLEFNNIEGKIGVTSVYTTSLEASSKVALDGVKITRSYSAGDNSKKNLQVNHLVKIEIDYEWGEKAPDGMYQITDYLPAGLKIVQQPFNWGITNDYKVAYPVEVSGQKASFMVYGKKSGSFSYYARVINAGEYQADAATIQHVKNGKIYYTTSRDKVKIQ